MFCEECCKEIVGRPVVIPYELSMGDGDEYGYTVEVYLCRECGGGDQ